MQADRGGWWAELLFVLNPPAMTLIGTIVLRSVWGLHWSDLMTHEPKQEKQVQTGFKPIMRLSFKTEKTVQRQRWVCLKCRRKKKKDDIWSFESHQSSKMSKENWKTHDSIYLFGCFTFKCIKTKQTDEKFQQTLKVSFSTFLYHSNKRYLISYRVSFISNANRNCSAHPHLWANINGYFFFWILKRTKKLSIKNTFFLYKPWTAFDLWQGCKSQKKNIHIPLVKRSVGSIFTEFQDVFRFQQFYSLFGKSIHKAIGKTMCDTNNGLTHT